MPSATDRTRGLPFTRRLLCQLSYEGAERSTSAVSIRERPVGRVSRCTKPGQGRAHPAPPTPSRRGRGVHGHTRSGADDESRTRGLDHGVVALCLLSYIRITQGNLGQFRVALAASC